MPRGIDAAVITELNSTEFRVPIYCVRITRSAGAVLRWSEHTITVGAETFERRLKSISGIAFTPDQSGPITIVAANIDGAVTTADIDVTFRGAFVEVMGYLDLSPVQLFSVWSGWADEISEISHEIATLIAYPTVYIPNVTVPKRQVGLGCTNVFANISNWVTIRDFEGSECPYQRVSTIGFFAGLVGAIDDSVTSITVYWGTTAPGMGAKFQKNDRIKLLNEVMLITDQPADPDPITFMQTLTVQRGFMSTVAASHTDNTPTYFNNCGKGVADCKRRGMYGNNTADSYSV